MDDGGREGENTVASEAYSQALTKLRIKFLSEAPARIEEARAHLQQIPAPEALTLLHRKLHDMAGNAGMLGCGAIEAEARAALAPVERADRPGGDLTPEERSQVAASLEAMTTAIRAESAAPDQAPSAQ